MQLIVDYLTGQIKGKKDLLSSSHSELTRIEKRISETIEALRQYEEALKVLNEQSRRQDETQQENQTEED